MTKDELIELAQVGMGIHSPNAPEYVVCEALIKALAQPEPWEKFCDSSCVWTDHHPDCKLAQPEYQSTADKSKLEKVPAKGTLLAQPEQEPVAWTLLLTGENNGLVGKAGKTFEGSPEYYRRVDVYTTPPQRTWVGLTDEEARKTFEEHNCTISADLAGILTRAIEAKLKEKNT